MKESHSSKAFIHYLETIGRDKFFFENAKKDFRLNQLELQILEAWNLLKATQFKKILEMTNKSSQDNLIKSQLVLVRAIALHNSGRMQESVPLFEESIELMNQYGLRRMTFIAYFNLFNACQNLKWNHRLAGIMQDWLNIPRKDLNEDIAVKRCQLRLFFLSNELKKAEDLVSWLEDHVEEMSELNRLNFHIDLFDLYVKKKDFRGCSQALIKLKKFRSYHYGAHFKYLKALVDFHLHDKPFYVYERDFTENKMLFYELSVLKYLEEKDLVNANISWGKLHSIDPSLYKKGFKIKVNDSLFALALKKLLHSERNQQFHLQNKSRMTKEQLVIQVLLSFSRIEKNKLYELVWGHGANSKSELTKLQLIIFRINKKGLYHINYRKGCYQLVQSSQSAS